ncbi:MAG: hypothetical protein WA919_05550 [Coleofasciculaceae cyanobacterium]
MTEEDLLAGRFLAESAFMAALAMMPPLLPLRSNRFYCLPKLPIELR